ncbi:hypothetical protein EG329_002039 [Mollisiaceae sp. DMI_Dod_QoI]|nr:hypothetical protein EG329_002039 [Helotiales sp. DMI_Dod_QoI]
MGSSVSLREDDLGIRPGTADDALGLEEEKRFPLDLAVVNHCQGVTRKLRSTKEKITQSWNMEGDGVRRYEALSVIKTVRGTLSLEQLDEETKKMSRDFGSTWMLDHPSFCIWVTTHNEELKNDAITAKQLAYEEATNGLDSQNL